MMLANFAITPYSPTSTWASFQNIQSVRRSVGVSCFEEVCQSPQLYVRTDDTSSATGADATALAQVAAVEECLEFTPDLGKSQDMHGSIAHVFLEFFVINVSSRLC